MDEFSGEVKIWPRTCAVAERLWNDPIISGKPYDPSLSPDEASYQSNWLVLITFSMISNPFLGLQLTRVKSLVDNSRGPTLLLHHDFTPGYLHLIISLKPFTLI